MINWRALCLAPLLCACTPAEQVYAPAVDTKPTVTTEQFKTADDTPLPSHGWLPKGKPKAVIVALHGFNDYSHAFEQSGQFFAQHRITLYAYDQRGFGASPQPGIWPGTANMTRDLHDYIKAVSRRNPGVPLYVMGESMGGAVTLATLGGPDAPEVQGVILIAPAVWGGDTMNPLYRSVLWTVVHVMPEHEFTGSDLRVLASNNIPMLRALVADPLVRKKSRADSIYGMVHLMDSAYEAVPQVHAPVLLLYGSCDEVIPRTPIHDTVERFPQPPMFAYYPNGYHMLTRDLQGEMVLKDIVSWIHDHDAPLPSGYGPADPEAMKSLDRDACDVLRHRTNDSKK